MAAVAVVVMVAFFLWLVRRDRPGPRFEDESGPAVDRDELRRAEEELAEDSRPRSLGDRADSEEAPEDDWGPGTGR